MPDLPLLPQHDPPAGLRDLDCIADGRQQWHCYISHMLAGAIDGIVQETPGDRHPVRFFDAATFNPGSKLLEVPILWNAFPRRLLSRFGRDKALVVADMLWPEGTDDRFDPLSPLCQHTMAAAAVRWLRPQDEYCEWRVERDAATQRIRRVIFTAESPDYWRALHGGTLDSLGRNRHFRFDGDPQFAARLYSRLLGRPVSLADLRHADGSYDPLNRWNTTHGIAHLTHPTNALRAQVQLCADASLVCRAKDGKPITDPVALCCARQWAQPERNSDPTIMGTLNALARRGAWLSLANPIGLCIDHVDTSGWKLPCGIAPEACLRIVRGTAGCILRLVVEVPEVCGLGLDQLTIAGEPLRHGGQIAECITVKALAVGDWPAAARPARSVPQNSHGWLLEANRHQLAPAPSNPGPGWIAAFSR